MSNIFYLAAARVADRVVLASMCTATDGTVFDALIRRVLNTEKIKELPVLVITTEHGHLAYKKDSTGELVFFVVTRDTYARRNQLALLEQFQADFQHHNGPPSAISGISEGGLTRKSKDFLGALLRRFDDPKTVDMISQVQGQVDEVTGTMKKNIDQILDNTDNLEALNDKTENLSAAAQTFQNNSNTLKKEMKMRNIKIIAIIVCLVSVLLLYVSVPIVLKIVELIKSVSSNDDSSSSS